MTRIGNPGILKQIIIRQLTEITKILDFPQYKYPIYSRVPEAIRLVTIQVLLEKK